MKISDRFAEYGITGAFFLVTQLIFLVVWLEGIPIAEWQVWMHRISALTTPVPTALQASIGGVLGILGIIGIFITGLLLDMFGSLFVYREMLSFKDYVDSNRGWIHRIVENNKEYIEHDFKAITSRLAAFLRMRKMKTISQHKGWRKFIYSLIIPFTRVKRMFALHIFVGPYNRVQSFLFSFVLIYSGASKLDVFLDQISLWRTSRAISTALAILGLESAIVAFFQYGKFVIGGLDANFLFSFFVWMLLYFVLFFVSLSITLRSYSRMCATLFSLAYVTHSKMQTDAIPSDSK